LKTVMLFALSLFFATASAAQDNRDWPVYGGAPENNHYSSLAQINRGNVNQLRVAWSFDTGEEGGLQTSPIIVDGVLYGITPTQKVFALNAATGALLWKFDSGMRGTQPDRGLAYSTRSMPLPANLCLHSVKPGISICAKDLVAHPPPRNPSVSPVRRSSIGIW
jgi:glucose dehydrogenase